MKFHKLYLLTLMLIFTISSYAQVAVITNKSVTENSISSNKLSEIYCLKAKTWSNGQAIVPLTFKSDDAVSDKFFSSMGKSYSDMKKLWMKLQLTGEGMAPEAVSSNEEIINKVASTPGSIGFIDAKKVTDKVKVLLTIN